MAFAPVFDLVVYGFSSGEANRIIKKLESPAFERGEVLRRLQELEKMRTLADGFKTSLSRQEVRAFVLSLPTLLLERSRRAAPKPLPAFTQDEHDEMAQRARTLITSVNMMAERNRMLRATGREWQENRGMLLQREVGIEYC